MAEEYGKRKSEDERSSFPSFLFWILAMIALFTAVTVAANIDRIYDLISMIIACSTTVACIWIAVRGMILNEM